MRSLRRSKNFLKPLNVSDSLKQHVAEWALRISLGGMYIYSGIDLIRHPSSWHWAVTKLPDLFQTIPNVIGIDLFIQIQGGFELMFALIFLPWFLPKILPRLVALLSTLEMIVITVFVGVDPVTFRDIGLVGAGIALYVLLINSRSGQPTV